MTEALTITTENVLHPRQTVGLRETKARLEGMLAAPAFIRNQLQDGGSLVQNQIDDIDKTLEQAAKPILPDQVDDAVRLEAKLREEWVVGMPTQAEMRRNYAGAVDKNIAWTNRNKAKILRWKQLMRRLHASGISKHRLADENDVSNIEMFRPVGGAQELNPDNAQIPRPTMKLPPAGAGPVAVMSDEQATLLKQVSPETFVQMGVFSNEQRAAILAMIDDLAAGGGAGEAQAAPSRSARAAAAPARQPARKRRAKAAGPKAPRTPKQLLNDARLSEQAKAHNADRSEKAAEG